MAVLFGSNTKTTMQKLCRSMRTMIVVGVQAIVVVPRVRVGWLALRVIDDVVEKAALRLPGLTHRP
jgi:hypothetical protein